MSELMEWSWWHIPQILAQRQRRGERSHRWNTETVEMVRTIWLYAHSLIRSQHPFQQHRGVTNASNSSKLWSRRKRSRRTKSLVRSLWGSGSESCGIISGLQYPAEVIGNQRRSRKGRKGAFLTHTWKFLPFNIREKKKNSRNDCEHGCTEAVMTQKRCI